MWKGHGMKVVRISHKPSADTAGGADSQSAASRLIGTHGSGAVILLMLAVGTAFPAFAAIDGTVTNGTTGQPQSGVVLTLVKPGAQGMQTLGHTTSDSGGHFHFANDQPGGGPQLVQAQFQDVTYNTLMTPNMPTSGVDIRIYNATKSPAEARITQHMIVVQPSDNETVVNETILVQNRSNTTFANADLGGAQFFLPPAANGQVRVQVQGPGGMPLPRPAEKTKQDNVFKIDYPVKPGETQFNLSYTMRAGSPFVLRGRVVDIQGQPSGPVRFVAPPGVTLESTDLKSLGQEPQTQATIYDLLTPAYAVNVTGTGSLGGATAEEADEADMPQVEQKNPPVYQHLAWLVGLALGILAVGVVLLYRSSPVREAGRPASR
jgi:hypothetical protein